MFLLNVGVTTLTERVPTATPGDDRGEEAKLRWEWVLESGGVGRWGMMGAGSGVFLGGSVRRPGRGVQVGST